MPISPITDINEFAISVTDIFADPIIGTPLVITATRGAFDLQQSKPLQSVMYML